MNYFLTVFFLMIATAAWAEEPSGFSEHQKRLSGESVEPEAEGVHSDAYGERLSQQQIDEADRVARFLSNVTTMTAEFIQESPDGTVASGKLYIKQPGGRMKWVYAPPLPVWMLSTGDFLIYVDEQIKQVSYIPIGETLAAFLAQDEIDFSDGIDVLDLRKGAGTIRLTIRQSDKPENGTLTLELEDKPLKLKSFVMTDQLGQGTRVTLNQVQYGRDIDPEIFVFKDPSKDWGPRVKR